MNMNPIGNQKYLEFLILSKIPIDAVLERYSSIDLSSVRGGKSKSVRCPFHHDKHPSFSYKVEKNIWRCWSGCGGGNVISFVQVALNISKSEAVKVLTRDFGLVNEKFSKREQNKYLNQLENKRRALEDFEKRYYKTLNALIELEYLLRVIYGAPKANLDEVISVAPLIRLIPIVEHTLDLLVETNVKDPYELQVRIQAVLDGEKLLNGGFNEYL